MRKYQYIETIDWIVLERLLSRRFPWTDGSPDGYEELSERMSFSGRLL